MKAAICTKYGPPDVLQIKEMPKPVPKDNEVLVRILAVPITTPDRRIRGLIVPFPLGQFFVKLFLRSKFGIPRPNLVLGSFMAGRVEAVGKNVTKFHVDDEVFACTGDQRGTYAEYTCLSEDALMTQKPSNLSFEESAAIPYGGCSALHFLSRAGGVKTGQKVLIYGASGAIGSSAVQLAKHFGAEVTGVCSGAKQDMVKSVGADFVIDYTTTDFTESDLCYDIIFDAAGKIPTSKRSKNLSENGAFITVFSRVMQLQPEDLLLIKTLAEAGEFKPVIDRCYPFERIAEAHKYADEGQAKGIVLVTFPCGGR